MGDAKPFPFTHFLAVTVNIGTVQVAKAVGKSMVAAVVGCPFQDRCLTGHLRHNANGKAHFWSRFKSAVDVKTVIADTNADIDEDIAEQKCRPFDPAGCLCHGPVKRAERSDNHRRQQYAIFYALCPRCGAADDYAMLRMDFGRFVIFRLNITKCRRHSLAPNTIDTSIINSNADNDFYKRLQIS